jgi:organic radical activating enzyme
VRAGDVIEQAVAAVGERGWLHVTGGEPTDQSDALQELVKQARRVGMYVHVQSSGVRRVPVQWDWLTISPKIDEPVQAFGQEMVVIDNGSVRLEWLQQLKATTSFWSYYLCPLWGRDMAHTASLAADAQWDLTWQMHKHAGLR